MPSLLSRVPTPPRMDPPLTHSKSLPDVSRTLLISFIAPSCIPCPSHHETPCHRKCACTLPHNHVSILSFLGVAAFEPELPSFEQSLNPPKYPRITCAGECRLETKQTTSRDFPVKLLYPMSLQGDCPQPFFQETQFPATGGCMLSHSSSELACRVTATLLTGVVLLGRLCLPTPTLAGNISCCLPCPSTDWIYSDGVPLSSLHVHDQIPNSLQASNGAQR
jgi:hypothetical protein